MASFDAPTQPSTKASTQNLTKIMLRKKLILLGVTVKLSKSMEKKIHNVFTATKL